MGFCAFGCREENHNEEDQTADVLARIRSAWCLAFGTTAPYYFQRNIAKAQESDTIKIGILHSLSGTIAIIETSLHNAELLAIEEINAKGAFSARNLSRS